MKRLTTIIVLLTIFSVCLGMTTEAAISITPLSDFTVEGAPARIAIGPAGSVYVSDPQKHRVDIYSNNGILLDAIEGIGQPVAIDSDNAGNIYVGDADTGSVMMFDSAGTFLTKLGAGDGEFIIPGGLVVTSTGDVFVCDPEAGLVKAFTSGGNFSFGSGTFIKPTGIAVDETVSPAELYIIDDDDGTGSIFGNRYVRVYSLGGSLLRNISLGGAFGGSTVVRPTGLRVDSSRLYVLDGYESAIAVMSKTGALETRLGSLGNGFGQLSVPTDLEFDTAGTLFVADFNNGRVNIYGVDKDAVISNTLLVSPSEISFSITNRDTIPSQNVTLDSSVSGLSWTAVSTEPWLEISSLIGATPETLTVSANAAALGSGTFSGQVHITTSDGILHVIDVKLSVNLFVSLSVTPLSLSFDYQSGSGAYPEQTLLIYSSGESVSWQAVPTVNWVTMSSYTGSTPASVTVRLNSNADELTLDGTASYSGLIKITAGGVPGSPADVALHLDLQQTGNVAVTTNQAASEFVLSGPQVLFGNGTSWTFDNVTTGDYSITFSHVEGYVRPPVQTFTVGLGETVSINGTYRPKLAATGLVALSGQMGTRSADMVDLTGSYLGSLSFLPASDLKLSGIDFAAGDLDSDGTSEVAFSDGRNVVEIYNVAGTLLETLSFPDATEVRISYADMDYDGGDDLIIGARTGSQLSIDVYGINSTGYLVRKSMYSGVRADGDFAVSAGDIDGDGLNELVVVDRDIKAYEPDGNGGLSILWMVRNSESGMPSLSVADLNGDGIAEVVIGYARDKLTGSRFYVLNGDGSGLTAFNAFADLGYAGGTYITTADVDGDYNEEVIAGAGPLEGNASLVRVFEGDGTFTGITFDALGLTSFGTRVKAGRF